MPEYVEVVLHISKLADATMPAVPYVYAQALLSSLQSEVRSQHRGRYQEFSTFHHAGSTSNEPLLAQVMHTTRNLLGRICAFILDEVVLEMLPMRNREHV